MGTLVEFGLGNAVAAAALALVAAGVSRLFRRPALPEELQDGQFGVGNVRQAAAHGTLE